MLLLGIFLGLVCLGVTFSFVPVLPGPPFAILAMMIIPFWPDPPSAVDDTTWWWRQHAAQVGYHQQPGKG